MFENRRGVARDRTAGGLAGWTDRSHQLVLPVAGAASVAAGLFLAVDRTVPWAVYAPELLVLFGVATFASGLARLALDRRHPVVSPVPSERRTTESWVICPSCSARSVEAVATAASGAGRATDLSPPTVPAAASLTAVADPGDAIWASWVAEVRRLPVELIGPVPETAYVPHRPGTPSLYEEGEPVLLASAIVAEEGNVASSTMIVASDGPPTEPVVTVELPAPEVGAPTVRPDRVPAFSPDRDAVVPGGSAGDMLLREALNPTPPHLRPRSQRAPGAATGRRPVSATSVDGTRCASCDSPVLSPASWRRCPDCLSPLCAECVVSALLTHERGWCSRCAELRHLEALPTELAPRVQLSTGAVGVSVVPALLSRPTGSGESVSGPRPG